MKVLDNKDTFLVTNIVRSFVSFFFFFLISHIDSLESKIKRVYI